MLVAGARGERARARRASAGARPTRRPRASAPSPPCGQVERLDERGRAVVERRVGDRQPGQARDHRLELEDRLEDALGHLGLVGRVGRHELRAPGERADHRRAPRGRRRRRPRSRRGRAAGGCAAERAAKSATTSGSGRPAGEVEPAGQAQRGRDRGEQLVEGSRARGTPASPRPRRRCGAGSRPPQRALGDERQLVTTAVEPPAAQLDADARRPRPASPRRAAPARCRARAPARSCPR